MFIYPDKPRRDGYMFIYPGMSYPGGKKQFFPSSHTDSVVISLFRNHICQRTDSLDHTADRVAGLEESGRVKAHPDSLGSSC